MWRYETVCRTRCIDMQHVNMSSERGAHHFTRFVDVLGTFLSRFGRQKHDIIRPDISNQKKIKIQEILISAQQLNRST